MVPGEAEPRRESSFSTNKNDAIRLLNEKRTAVDKRKISSGTATVSDLLDLFLADLRKRKRKSYASAEGYVRLHLIPAFGKIKASEITSGQIDRFIEQKQQHALSDSSINRYLSALRRGFVLGSEALPPLVTNMPPIGDLMLDEDNVREGFLESWQYENLCNELPAHLRLVLVIGYHFGMRRGEILGLRWDQVDWDANLIRLEKKQTKAKQARIAPMYGEVRGRLEMAFAARPEDCNFIVAWNGKGIEQVKTAWNKARERAGVPLFLVHDLRRTAARNMIRAGIPEKQVMAIAGWKTRSMFDRYLIVDERDYVEAGHKYDRYMEEQALKVGTKLAQSSVPEKPADHVN